MSPIAPGEFVKQKSASKKVSPGLTSTLNVSGQLSPGSVPAGAVAPSAVTSHTVPAGIPVNR